MKKNLQFIWQYLMIKDILVVRNLDTSSFMFSFNFFQVYLGGQFEAFRQNDANKVRMSKCP